MSRERKKNYRQECLARRALDSETFELDGETVTLLKSSLTSNGSLVRDRPSSCHGISPVTDDCPFTRGLSPHRLCFLFRSRFFEIGQEACRSLINSPSRVLDKFRMRSSIGVSLSIRCFAWYVLLWPTVIRYLWKLVFSRTFAEHGLPGDHVFP